MSLTKLLALAGALGIVSACGGDDADQRGSDGTAETGGSSGGGSGGGGGTTPAPLNPRHIVTIADATGGSAGAGGAEASPRLLVAGTDFVATTEIATLNLDTGEVTESVTFSDGDAVPAQSHGLGFVLERTNDQVHVLDELGGIATSIDVGESPTLADVSPQDKGYVLLYNTNHIGVLDLAAASLAKLVDLSELVATGDSDGLVELDKAVFDRDSGRLYVTLARIDRATILTGLVCPAEPALLVGIDVQTDSLVDLNGEEPGSSIELSLAAPVDLVLDDAGRRLMILASGCLGDGTEARQKHGVESLNLTTFATEILLGESSDDFLSQIIWLDAGGALVAGFDADFVEFHKRWNGVDAALGATLSNVPGALSYAGDEAFYGIDFDGGATVVRYSSTDEATTPLLSNPWEGNFEFSGGGVVAR